MNEARRMRGREELATSSPPLLWGDEGKGRRWLSGQFAHAVASCPQPSQVLLALWTDEGNEIPRYRITVQRLYEFVLLVDISKLPTTGLDQVDSDTVGGWRQKVAGAEMGGDHCSFQLWGKRTWLI